MTGPRPADQGAERAHPVAAEADSGAIRRDLQPRGPPLDGHLRPRAPAPARPAQLAGQPIGRLQRPGGRVGGRGRRLCLGVAVQGAGGLPDDGRGLRVRAADRHGLGIGRSLLLAVLDAAEASGFHAVMARIEAGGAASRALPRGLRLPPRRRRAGGRPEVQPLARHRRSCSASCTSGRAEAGRRQGVPGKRARPWCTLVVAFTNVKSPPTSRPPGTTANDQTPIGESSWTRSGRRLPFTWSNTA